MKVDPIVSVAVWLAEGRHLAVIVARTEWLNGWCPTRGDRHDDCIARGD